MEEKDMQERINEILEEYSALPQLSQYDLSLEAVGEHGDVKVTLKKGEITIEKTFGYKESLEVICETFDYSDSITPHNCNIASMGIKMLYFDEFGYLYVVRKGTEERFKVKESHRDTVTDILKEKFGSLFKA